MRIVQSPGRNLSPGISLCYNDIGFGVCSPPCSPGYGGELVYIRQTGGLTKGPPSWYNSPIMRTIPDRLRDVQESEGLSGAQFARKLGISHTELSKFYNGKLPLGRKMLTAIKPHYPGLFSIASDEYFTKPTPEPLTSTQP